MFFKLRQSKDSFEKCFKPHMSYLYRVAFHLSGNNEDAEDLVHDLILKVHSGKVDLFTLDNPKTWLAKILYRLFVDKYRQKKRMSLVCIDDTEHEQDITSPVDQLDNATNPERLVEQFHFMQNIEKALFSINEEQRILIIMYEIEGFSLSEISQALDTPVGTLKSRLHRARIKLRQYLENNGTVWASESCSTSNTSNSKNWQTK